jgi:hypothetical protein
LVLLLIAFTLTAVLEGFLHELMDMVSQNLGKDAVAHGHAAHFCMSLRIVASVRCSFAQTSRSNGRFTGQEEFKKRVGIASVLSLSYLWHASVFVLFSMSLRLCAVFDRPASSPHFLLLYYQRLVPLLEVQMQLELKRADDLVDTLKQGVSAIASVLHGTGAGTGVTR